MTSPFEPVPSHGARCGLLSVLLGPLGRVDTARVVDREEPLAVPADEQRARDVKIGAVLAQRHPSLIDVDDLVALASMTVTDDHSRTNGFEGSRWRSRFKIAPRPSVSITPRSRTHGLGVCAARCFG